MRKRFLARHAPGRSAGCGAHFLRGYFARASYELVMDNVRDNLGVLLRQWPDIEPTADFEAGVWRRIRRAQASPGGCASRVGWLRGWLAQPALPVATAVAVATLIGAWSGLGSAAETVPASPLSLLAADTLAGGYLRITEGRGR
jgi:hypothetical protein